MGDTVLLLEHEPVITLGRGTRGNHVLLPEVALKERGIELQEVGRGGDATLHAPGQLVGYPILSLEPDRCDVRRYVNDLTQTMAELIAPYGVVAGTIPDLIGLWVDLNSPQKWNEWPKPPPREAPAVRSGAPLGEAAPSQASRAERPTGEQLIATEEESRRLVAKIGAIGVKVSRWVTMHGFALNLLTDLELFSLIIPCGISEYGVTSLARLTGERLTPEAAAKPALEALASRFSASSELVDASSLSLAELGRQLGLNELSELEALEAI